MYETVALFSSLNFFPERATTDVFKPSEGATGAVRRKILAKIFRGLKTSVVASVYLIPFATHAFVLESQERTSTLPSLSVFPMISTDFTPTP